MQIPPGLQRFPIQKRELLQAWDSADELLIHHLTETPTLLDTTPRSRVLILGDSFGALSLALEKEGRDVTTYTDSYLGAQGIQNNSQGRIRPISQLNELQGLYDLVLVRIPKNLSFFEDQLCHLTAYLKAGSKVIFGYMLKHQADTSFDLINRYIGPTTTSLARKKARLIFADFNKSSVSSPYPLQVQVDGFDFPFVNASNLFSREKLDIGTRFLLEHLPEGAYEKILDLGCANGIVGIAAKQLNPEARIIFTDESRMAVQSAHANFENYFPGRSETEAEFHWTHCHEGGSSGSLDLVLCNPPFHQGTAVGEQVAWQMFRDAHRALAPRGILRVVGNSHLPYGDALSKIFGNSRGVARSSKFTIVEAMKR